MLRHFIDHANARSANRVTKGLEATRRIHGNLSADSSTPFFYVAPSFAALRETEVFNVEDFCDGEAIVAFNEINIFYRHASLFVGGLCSLGSGRETSVGKPGFQIWFTRSHGQPYPFHQHGVRTE